MNFHPISPTSLDATSLHLWLFSLADWMPHSKLLLNEAEIQRAERFYFERHQRRFATARTRVREILGCYLDEAPENIIFTYEKHGKPCVINNRNLHFNVSHTGDWGILAVSLSPVGVDIEQYSGRSFIGIGENLFSETEQQALITQTPATQAALFFRIWALKEAFIKANGCGLSYPLQQITVPLYAQEPILLEDALHQQTWKIQHFMPLIAVSAAFCCDPAISNISLHTWM